MVMITLITCGETKIFASKFHIITAPGVGSVQIDEFATSIWTGDVHIWPAPNAKASIHIGDISSVETRSSLDEDNEDWQTHFTREYKPFSYEYEAELTKILVKVSEL